MADKTSTGEKPVLVQRVDKVDTLLDGDAGSRRLVILALLPLSPPVPPLLLKNSGNTRVSAGFRL